MSKRITIIFVSLAVVVAAATVAQGVLTPQEELGKALFFDTALSTPIGQSCAACHAPEAGWTGPTSSINAGPSVYPGAVHTRAGNRKPPSSGYASFSPPFYYDEDEEMWIGGQFWDGRASTLVDQAKGPFLNPLEQNNPNPRVVCVAVSLSSYATLFEEVFGPGSLDFVQDVPGTYDRIAVAIAAYEASEESNQFTSKYDYYLAGMTELTPEEQNGLNVFEGKGNCAACHPNTPGPYSGRPLFTDYTYDNLGVPKNPSNPFYSMPRKWNPDGADWVDLGLGFTTGQMADWGKFKVPTLRNVDKRPNAAFVKAYGHNGFFKSLKEIVHFYNTRDVEPWPAPEVGLNINTDELGNLGLTDSEEDDLVAFMKTLSDGYVPAP